MEKLKEDEVWEFKIEMGTIDPLLVARMNLFSGTPDIVTTPTQRYMQTPWQYYSRLYKERFGVYPEMWGFTTLKNESDEKSPF